MTPADSPPYLTPENINQVSDVPGESSASVLTRRKLRASRASSITHAVANRTCSPPTILSSSQHRRVKRWVSEPYGLESTSSHSVATPKLYPARNPEGPITPHNSDDFSESGSATPQLWRSRSDPELVEFTAQENFAKTLRERLMFWAKPLILNPYKSTGCEYSGTDGRPSSPTMVWLVGRESAIFSSTNLDHDSRNETLTRESALPGCSTWPSTSLDQVSVYNARNRPSDGEQLLIGVDSTHSFETYRSSQSTRHNDQGSCSSDSAFQGSYLPGKLRFISSFLANKRSSLPPRRIQLLASDVRETRPTTPIEESRVDQISDIWSVKDNLKAEAEGTQSDFRQSPSSNSSGCPLLSEPEVGSAVRPVSDPRLRYKSLDCKLLESPGLKPTTSRPTPEKGFLEDLDRRLSRLDYELSPGYRGPRGREATGRTRWQVVPYHFSVLDGLSQPTQANPRPSFELPPATTHTTDTQPKKKKPRNATSLDNDDDRRSFIPSEIPRVDPAPAPAPATATATIRGMAEPREGIMDTAAWILRRPPMCARPSRTAEQALLYTDGRVTTKPKPLAAWQQLDS